MKKIFFSSVAAALSAFGLFSFKAANQSFSSFYYFKIKIGSGANANYANEDLLGTYGITPPSRTFADCPTAASMPFDCVVDFTTGQLNSLHTMLLTNGFGQTVQTAAGTLYHRSIR